MLYIISNKQFYINYINQYNIIIQWLLISDDDAFELKLYFFVKPSNTENVIF